jgi:hypothetical protein
MLLTICVSSRDAGESKKEKISPVDAGLFYVL